MKLHLLLLLLLSCLSQRGLTEDEPTTSTRNAPSPSGEQEEGQSCGAAFSPEEYRAIGGTIERLGLQLLQSLPVSSRQPNVVLSPLSMALALAQLTLGARNETERLLLQNLNPHSLPCYHHVLGSLLPHFRQRKTLQVAARTYMRPGFEVKLSFVEESLSRYQSRPVPLVSVEEVNQWVENATNGHISNFLESIPHDVVLMLMNAVFFKGEWQTQFDPQGTSKGDFYLDNQNTVSVDIMKSPQYPLRLMDDAELEAQVASFPFKGNTSFLVVLPRGNVSSVIPKLNISDLFTRLPQETTMQVNLPKVNLLYQQELQEALTSMGLSSLFSGPDLSGISDLPIKVTEVRHACRVELSEEGVEASGSTAVTSMRSVSLFSVNSPFFFALLDHASLTPLFMGVVTNPAPDHDQMLHDDPHSNQTLSNLPASTDVCSAPSGENQPLQNQNGTEEIVCTKPESSVPV